MLPKIVIQIEVSLVWVYKYVNMAELRFVDASKLINWIFFEIVKSANHPESSLRSIPQYWLSSILLFFTFTGHTC